MLSNFLAELWPSFMTPAAQLAAAMLIAVILLEVGYLAFASIGAVRFCLPKWPTPSVAVIARPKVACVITCYGEGVGVQHTIRSLADQDYSGVIEIIAVVDGAVQNRETFRAIVSMQSWVATCPRRTLRALPKLLRGGRASSLNAGLAVAEGDVVMALDGDTSFDRDMVRLAVLRLQESGVVAVAGTLRVRNFKLNLLTRLQALDYLIFRQWIRTGLGEFNVINNIPGAHGIFRTRFLRKIGGWDTGSAEDVDLLLRIKKFFGRYPHLRIVADPHVISHTDVPEAWRDFLKQRLRWEGDPVYLYLRKHGPGLRPAVVGWRNYFFSLCYAVLLQILMPPTLLISFVVLLWLADPHAALGVLLLAYTLLLLAFLLVCCMQLFLISGRPREDASLFWVLPVYPLFVFFLRLWSALAVFHSLLLRSHLDTAMAPWWVLRKGKF